MPSPQLTTLVTVFRARPKRRLDDIDRAREEFEAFTQLLKIPPGTRTVAVDAGGVAAEWVLAGGTAEPPGPPSPPSPETPSEALVWFHGGGYANGSLSTHRPLTARLAEGLGLPVLSVDYSLAPEHPFPAAHDDALAALEWIVGPRVGVAPDRLLVGGDSAGGGLALAALIARRDGGAASPAGLLLLSPWTDLAVTGESVATRDAADPLFDRASLTQMADLYRDGVPATHPWISPLYADLHDLPPTFVQVGGAEVMLSDTTRLTERLRHSGVPVAERIWDGLFHSWQLYASMLPEGEEAVAEVVEHGRRMLGQEARAVRETPT
jgi:acetyl esterase/lipase